MQGLTVNYTVP